MNEQAALAIQTPENMARWWGQAPLGIARGAREGLAAAMWRFEANAPFEVHAEPDTAMHILSPILSGGVDCELFLDSRRRYRRPIRAGDFNLIRAGETPRAVEYTADTTFLHLYLPQATLERFVREELPGAPALELLPVQVERDDTVAAIARAIAAEMRTPAIGSRLIVDGLTLQLAGHMVRHWSNLAPRRHKPPPAGLAPWQVSRVTEYLIAHLAEDVSLDELAALVGLSRWHFCRAFKQCTGAPPHQWRLARRMERACELLERTDLPVSGIAAAVGYDDPGQFATTFRSVVGCAPRRYRQERRA